VILVTLAWLFRKDHQERDDLCWLNLLAVGDLLHQALGEEELKN